MRGGRKGERLREREDQSGWNGGGQIGFPACGSFVLSKALPVTQYGRSAARSTIGGGGQISQCVGEPGGAWPGSIVKIGARPCMAGDRRGGSVMREGWAEIWVDRCLWVLGVWLALDLGGQWCVEVAAQGDSA